MLLPGRRYSPPTALTTVVDCPPRLEYSSCMRALLAAIVVALALAPLASAEFGPPLASVPSTLKTIPVVYLKNAEDRSPSPCSVHARRSPGAVGKIERKL